MVCSPVQLLGDAVLYTRELCQGEIVRWKPRLDVLMLHHFVTEELKGE
jgi:hypothetical protein